MELLYVYYVAVFYLGAILGSFLNVVTLDLQKLFRENNLEGRNEFSFFARHWTQRYFWQSVLQRRSHCDTCNTTLGTFELFPIFSYLLQRGKCKKCGTPIDSGHLWVEIACGVLFLGVFTTVFWQFDFFSGGFLLALLFWFTVFGLLFVAALFDARTKIVPDILLAGVGILLVANTFFSPKQGLMIPETDVYLAAGIFALLFYTVWFISRGEWVGFADGKIAALIGLLFGISQGFTVLAVAFWSGALVSLSMVAWQKIRKNKDALSLRSAVAFGPFMVFAMWYVFVTDINLFVLTW